MGWKRKKSEGVQVMKGGEKNGQFNGYWENTISEKAGL